MARDLMLDIVVPSAKPLSTLRQTLPALAVAADEASVPRDSVCIMDEAPSRAAAELIEQDCGFRRVVTRGIGAGPARNAGARLGRAPWLLFLDDDVEVDPCSLKAAIDLAKDSRETAVVGGLRPPHGSPAWLGWAYADATLTPASSLAGDRGLPPVGLAAAFLLIRRSDFERAQGFPNAPGIEDSLLGLALARNIGADLLIRCDGRMSGVHHYVPTWDEWLARNLRTGRQLQDVIPSLGAEDAVRLLDAHSLGRDLRGRAKRIVGALPRGLWSRPRGRLHARLAAAGAEASGFLGRPR